MVMENLGNADGEIFQMVIGRLWNYSEMVMERLWNYDGEIVEC